MYLKMKCLGGFMFQSFFFLDLGDGRIPSRGDSAAAPAVGDSE